MQSIIYKTIYDFAVKTPFIFCFKIADYVLSSKIKFCSEIIYLILKTGKECGT
jgi:hypothetical protein